MGCGSGIVVEERADRGTHHKVESRAAKLASLTQHGIKRAVDCADVRGPARFDLLAQLGDHGCGRIEPGYLCTARPQSLGEEARPTAKVQHAKTLQADASGLQEGRQRPEGSRRVGSDRRVVIPIRRMLIPVHRSFERSPDPRPGPAARFASNVRPRLTALNGNATHPSSGDRHPAGPRRSASSYGDTSEVMPLPAARARAKDEPSSMTRISVLSWAVSETRGSADTPAESPRFRRMSLSVATPNTT